EREIRTATTQHTCKRHVLRSILVKSHPDSGDVSRRCSYLDNRPALRRESAEGAGPKHASSRCKLRSVCESKRLDHVDPSLSFLLDAVSSLGHRKYARLANSGH